jgi:hypothetical protein
VFVKEGLLRSLSPSDDELAVVLAHEVAHVVLGHTGSNLDSSNHMQALLLGAQLVLLSAIDLTGVLSFLLESALDSLRMVAFAAYSRQHESEVGSSASADGAVCGVMRRRGAGGCAGRAAGPRRLLQRARRHLRLPEDRSAGSRGGPGRYSCSGGGRDSDREGPEPAHGLDGHAPGLGGALHGADGAGGGAAPGPQQPQPLSLLAGRVGPACRLESRSRNSRVAEHPDLGLDGWKVRVTQTLAIAYIHTYIHAYIHTYMNCHILLWWTEQYRRSIENNILLHK